MVTAITTTKDNEAWNRYRRIIELKWQTERNFLEIGKELYAFQELKQWRMNWSSFNSFLADPEVNFSQRNAYRLIRVWKEYVVGLNVQQEKLIAIGGSKLDMMAAHVDEENLDRMLNTAVTLSRSDLHAHLKGIEPVYHAFNWRECLREARSLCYELMQSDAPDEVKSFAADFWTNTKHHSP